MSAGSGIQVVFQTLLFFLRLDLTCCPSVSPMQDILEQYPLYQTTRLVEKKEQRLTNLCILNVLSYYYVVNKQPYIPIQP